MPEEWYSFQLFSSFSVGGKFLQLRKRTMAVSVGGKFLQLRKRNHGLSTVKSTPKITADRLLVPLKTWTTDARSLSYGPRDDGVTQALLTP